MTEKYEQLKIRSLKRKLGISHKSDEGKLNRCLDESCPQVSNQYI